MSCKTLLACCLALSFAFGCEAQPQKKPAQTADDPKVAAAQGVETKESAAKIQEGIDAVHAKDYAKAKQSLTEARTMSPKSPRPTFYLAVAEQGLNNLAGARKAFEDTLVIDPKIVEARINLSAMLINSDKDEDLAEAVKVLDEGLKLDPENVDLTRNRAVASMAMDDFAGAAAGFAKVVAKLPKDLFARYQYARALSEGGQFDQALKELPPVYESDDPKLLAAAGALHVQTGDYKGCVEALDKVIARKPTADLYLRRGACKKGLKDFKSELEDYKEAVKADGNSAFAHLALGRHLHYIENDEKQALMELETAKKLGQGTPVVAEADKTIALIKPKK